MRREPSRRDGEAGMGSHRRGAALLVPALLAAVVLGGCGSSEPEESAAELLDRAKTTLDDASSAHFVLTSENAPKTGTALIGGEGDIARPASFEGTLKVVALGATADLEVVSVDGTVYAQLPFTSGFSVVDPAQFGFGDPGALLDPDTGISQLLSQAESAELGEEKRVDGEVVREVSAEIPGDLVEQILTSEDPSTPVQGLFSIASDSGELRRAQLTGPFFSADEDATFILELSDFGADVEITAPPTG
jgi:lipoprotein LprG